MTTRIGELSCEPPGEGGVMRSALGGFSSIAMQPALSWNSISFQGTPSLTCSASSSLKTQVRKNCCSFSLAKLMQSCDRVEQGGASERGGIQIALGCWIGVGCWWIGGG